MESPLTLPGISQLLIMFQGHFFTIRKASWVNLVLIFFWKTQLSALRLACHCKKLEICSLASLSSLSVLFLFDNYPPFKTYDSCVVFTGNDSMSWYWSARIAAFSWMVGQIGVLEDSSFLSRVNGRAIRLLCDLGKLAGHNWSCSMAGFLTTTINSFDSITFFPAILEMLPSYIEAKLARNIRIWFKVLSIWMGSESLRFELISLTSWWRGSDSGCYNLLIHDKQFNYMVWVLLCELSLSPTHSCLEEVFTRKPDEYLPGWLHCCKKEIVAKFTNYHNWFMPFEFLSKPVF